MDGDARGRRIGPAMKMLQKAAADGRAALFGPDLSLVAWAIGDALPPFGAPDINLEVPLAGEPGTDVHVRCSRHHFHGGGAASPGAFWDAHPSLLGWAEAELRTGEGVGVSYDLRKRRLETPAVYYRGTSVDSFFSSLGLPEAARRHRSATERLPKGWRCWYQGSFPNRDGSPVRLGILLTREAQDRYVGDRAHLADDLATAGIGDIGDRAIDLLCEQASQPYLFDIELDVMDDGSVGETVGFNLTLGLAGDEAREALSQGGLHDVLAHAQASGLADDRWRLLGEAAFRHLAPSAHGGPRGYVCCENRLVYVKLRMRGNEPLDAKAYFQTVWSRV